MHNPGMSEKAWDKFHKMLARFNLKYAAKILIRKKNSKSA
jgi:hypothetical protein